MRSRRSLLPVFCLAIVLANLDAPVDAAEPIIVKLTSGEVLRGAIAPETDESELCLQFGSGAIKLTRFIAWDRIQHGVCQDAILTAAELRQFALSQKDTAAMPAPAPQVDNFVRFTPAPAARPAVGWTPSPKVRSLLIEAYLSNWDADADGDGLLVRLMPRDHQGLPVIVSGMVELECVAARRRTASERPSGRGVAVETIARWTAQIGPRDYGPDGATLRLPFQGADPQFDERIAPLGMVRVRLATPGHGVFEASQDSVTLRPASFTRDQLQLTGQGRRLSWEASGAAASNISP